MACVAFVTPRGVIAARLWAELALRVLQWPRRALARTSTDNKPLKLSGRRFGRIAPGASKIGRAGRAERARWTARSLSAVALCGMSRAMTMIDDWVTLAHTAS